MSVLRDHYYKLASELPKERIEAATALLSDLAKVDKSEEWDYALNRLIKGLSTSRQSARFGFSMALTELIRELILKDTYDLTISSFLTKVVDASRTASSMKGKEIRSTLFGRLFGFQALVNCQLLLDSKVTSEEAISAFVKEMVQLSSSKSWLREPAMFTLCQFFDEYLKSAMASDELTVSFLQIISDEGLTFTTEGLAFLLTIPSSSRGTLCSQVSSLSYWKHGDPFAKGNMPLLAKVLKDVEVVQGDEAEDDNKNSNAKDTKKKGTWSPRLPFVWDLILKHFADAESEDDSIEEILEGSKKRKKSASQKAKKKAKTEAFESIQFKEFWTVAVDQTLFADKASSERKFWGFELFNKFLVSLPSTKIEFIFTPNFVRCLINQAAQNNRNLHKISTKLLNSIIETCHADFSKIIPCLTTLTSDELGVGWKFDSSTKSKVTDALVGSLSYLEKTESISDLQLESFIVEMKNFLITSFEEKLQSQTTSDATANNSRGSNDNHLKWVLDKLIVFFRSLKRFKVDITVHLETVFKFLVRITFLKTKNGQNSSEYIYKQALERLNAFLSEFIAVQRKGHSWSFYCVKQLEKLEKKSDFDLVLELSDELDEVKTKGLEVLDSIKHAMKRQDSTQSQYYSFELLFSMVLLQLYAGETEAVNVLDDLNALYKDAFLKEDSETDPAVVLTEILLSFVSKKSSLLKRLSNIVWESYLCSQNSDGQLNVNDSCFKLLFDILQTKENEEGQKQLFEGEEEFEEEAEEDSDSASDSEEEEEGAAGKKSTAEKSDDGKLVEQVEQETTIKLANALGISAEYNGEVKYDEIDSFGEDDDDYESESMDDEQMMAIDGELSRIFLERRSALSANSTSKKNAEKAQAKENIILFKNRVLDLMETFSKKQTNSIYNLSFIKPLIQLINLTTDKNLGVKAHKLLKTRISKMRVNPAEIARIYPTDEDKSDFISNQLDFIRWLHLQAGKYSSSHAHGAACVQSCIIVSKCVLVVDKAAMPKIITIYGETLTQWASEPKNRIQATMFFDFINWINAKRSNSA